MTQYPQFVRELDQQARTLATKLGVPHASLVGMDGLYIMPRRRRDPINTNRKRNYIKVQFRREGVVIFENLEPMKGFPSEHLIAQLALII